MSMSSHSRPCAEHLMPTYSRPRPILVILLHSNLMKNRAFIDRRVLIEKLVLAYFAGPPYMYRPDYLSKIMRTAQFHHFQVISDYNCK